METNKLTPAKIAGYFGMALVVLLIGVPIFWMISGSLMSNKDILDPNQWIPSTPIWENYPDAWTRVPFAKFFMNSAIITVPHLPL